MEERFTGFRFSIRGDGLREIDVKEKIQQKADELFCFGWVQDFQTDIVGEARCHKKLGHEMKLYLVEDLKDEISIQETIVKDYTDSKIKLHFSHFKILHTDRITCFRDQPHQCEDLSIPLW